MSTQSNYNSFDKNILLLKSTNMRCQECRHLQNGRKRCIKQLCNHSCCYEPVIIRVTNFKTHRNRATIGTCLAELINENY